MDIQDSIKRQRGAVSGSVGEGSGFLEAEPPSSEILVGQARCLLKDQGGSLMVGCLIAPIVPATKGIFDVGSTEEQGRFGL